MRRLTAGGQAFEVEPARAGYRTEGFQEWLQGQLRARKMSQRQLAQKSGVDHSSISRLVRGDRVPSLRTVMRLARGLDRTDPTGNGVRPEPAAAAHPVASVEYALRADDRLSEADVREIMLYYLASRTGRSSRTGTATPLGKHTNDAAPTTARVTGVRPQPEQFDRRRTPRRP